MCHIVGGLSVGVHSHRHFVSLVYVVRQKSVVVIKLPTSIHNSQEKVCSKKVLLKLIYLLVFLRICSGLVHGDVTRTMAFPTTRSMERGRLIWRRSCIATASALTGSNAWRAKVRQTQKLYYST